MEGVGSRLGRASSRYGPAATVFNGPVRKWKKRWVHVSSSSTVTYHKAQSNGRNSSNSNNGGSHLLLCRWTPIPPSSSAAASAEADSVSDGAPHEPPRRKFRYTPISVLEQQKKIADRKVEDEMKAKETDQSIQPATTVDHEMHGNPNMNYTLKKGTGDYDLTNDCARILGFGEEENGLKTLMELKKSASMVSNMSTLDLGLGLKGNNINLGSVGHIQGAEMKRAWSMV